MLIEDRFPNLESAIAQRRLDGKSDYWDRVEEFYNDIAEQDETGITDKQMDWLERIVEQLTEDGFME